jgi:hypothetical protein
LALKLALCFFRIIFASWLLLFWRQNYILASGPNLGVHHTIPFFLQTIDNEIQPEKIDEQLPLMLEVVNDLLAKIKLTNNMQ